MSNPVQTFKVNKSSGMMLLLLAVAILAISLGYFIGFKKGSAQSIPTQTSAIKPSVRIGPSSIIKSQQAVASGKITKVEGNEILILGNDNQSARFKLSLQPNIFPPNSSASAAISKPSHNPQDIRLNMNAIVTLILDGNDYVASSISYVPTGSTIK